MKQLHISIPTPCQENWAEMQANDLGKFCFSCQKTVIDFTGKSEREIAEILLGSKGKICGRFRESQLKTIELPEPTLSKNHFKTYFFALSNVILASLFVPMQQAKAQVKVETVTKKETKEFLEEKIIQNKSIEKLVVMGAVKDKKTKENLAGITIYIKGTNKGVVSDAEGNFQIEIDNKAKEQILVFSFVGFKTQEVKITKTADNHYKTNIVLLNVDLEEDEIVLGDICVVVYDYDKEPLYKIAYRKLRNLLRF
jgi:hypothetical protein